MSALLEELRNLDAAGREAFLHAHSGLPGPRANLSLADDFAAVADEAQILDFADSADEYLCLCGTTGLGRLLRAGHPDALPTLLRNAGDQRWRVREGVARALQAVGDADPGLLGRVVRDWAGSRDPLVQRAALAAVCEPRLLRDPATASIALEVCERVTAQFAAIPQVRRRTDPVRILRQGLGYCWSVAIAAAPERGLELFESLAGSDDPDLLWIVRENSTKARLGRLL